MNMLSINSSPLVSVCIPVYNAGKYIKKTIDCILYQTYKNIEIIVVDDQSIDNSLHVLNGYKGDRLKIITQPNAGAGAARNIAFKHSEGELIKFMDADDLLNSAAIEEQVKLSIQHPESVISGKWGRFYNDDLSTFKEAEESVWKNMKGDEWIIQSWLQGPNMTQPGIFLLPRKLIECTGLWTEDLSKGPFDDMEFYTKTILGAEDVIFSNSSILYYRSGIQGSLSKTRSRIAFEKALKTIQLSIAYLLENTSHEAAKTAAANQLQSFAYNCYEFHPDLFQQAVNQINELGGSNYKFQSGGYTRILTTILGWKFAKKIKYYLT